MKTFASVYIGSYAIVCKVYEISKEKKVKEIDCLRTWCGISKDTMDSGVISKESLNKLLSSLKDMKQTIATYKCDSYRIYAGYTLQMAENTEFVLDQIKLHLDLDVHILTNSEQRFFSYLALSSATDFDEIISDCALLVDIGGASIQVTLFEEGEIITTEHLLLGATKIQELLSHLKDKKDSNTIVSEIIKKEISSFTNIYLKNKKPDYLILLNDQIHNVANKLPVKSSNHIISNEEYATVMDKLKKKQLYTVISESFEYDTQDEMLMPFILLYQNIIEMVTPEKIMIPGVSVSEGIAYNFAYKEKLLKANHNFDEDVLSASWAIARRYDSYIPHLKALETMSMEIFDAVKKLHHLTARDRLLMQVVCILHDCGKYISISDAPQCTFTIIMTSEILGLTHKERLLVAYIASSNRGKAKTYEEMAFDFTRDEYMKYLKLLAILRVANAMDRSHKQKFKKIHISLKDNTLSIGIEVKDSIELEKGLFETKADFFEDVFAIRPVIHEKRR
ncbi:MAG: phosphatase [Lachnospiraceae bacterium]|nr:phosphatase [Lachnospiraceae bacterium]